MHDTIRLGRIAGIPIGVNWTVLVVGWLITWSLAGRLLPGQAPGLPPIVYWVAAIGVASLFLASLLAHELAHAVVARRNGLEVEGITLWLLGGVAKLRGEAASPGAEARIAVMGPLTSLAVAGLAWLAAVALGSLEPTGAAVLLVVGVQWLTVVNVVLALFNLLPGAPLDGGRVARAVVWAIRDDRLEGTRAASFLGRALGYGLAVLGVIQIVIGADLGGLWSIVLGFFLSSAAGIERRQAEILDVLEGIRVGDVMTRDPVRAPGSLTADAFIEHVLPTAHASTWLVTDVEDRPIGLLGLERLGRLRGTATRSVRLSDIVTPLAALPRTTPDEALVDLLGRLDADEAGARVMVIEGGETIVGLLLPEDVARAIEIGRLRPRRRGQGTGGRTAADQGRRV